MVIPSHKPAVETPSSAQNLFATMSLPMEPISVRIAVAMALTGLGRTKIYELIKREELATAKAGTSTLVIVASLKDYILRSTQK